MKADSPRSTGGRRRGRPTGATSEATRKRILDAGLALFSSWGYDATRIKDVALRADVDAALVHHYFGDKDELYQAVLADTLRPLRILGQKLLLKGLPVDLLLAAWVEIVSTYFERHPDVLHLITRECIGDARRIRKVVVETLGPIFEQTVEALETGFQRNGDKRLDATYLVVNTLGMIAVWHTHASLIEAVLGEKITAEKQRLRQRDQIMQVLLHGALSPAR